MEWVFNNEVLASPPDGFVGFVYIISNKLNDKKYIGKKLFFFAKTKVVKGKKKRIKIESDWKDYWSSSDELKEDVKKLGKENFSREILFLCENKGLLNYLEARTQMDHRVLESDKWYNNYIMCRIHGSHVKKLQKNI